MHVDGASGAFVWPFLYPDSKWDFQLEQVRSINVSGHKYGLVYPGIGWLVFREKSDLAEDLVFYENYLGKTDATFTLNFSTGASMVLAQYYNFVRLGREGYTYVMKQMQTNARVLAENLRESGRFEVIGEDLEQLPLVAFRLKPGHDASYDESDVAWQLSAERGWMVPAYTLPPKAEKVKILRALVKETMSREQVDMLTADIEDACQTLDEKGGTTRPNASRSSRAPATSQRTGGDPERQREGERAAASRVLRALRGCRRIRFDQLLADRQAEPGPAVLARRGGVHLGERLEEAGELVAVDADSRVLDDEAHLGGCCPASVPDLDGASAPDLPP